MKFAMTLPQFTDSLDDAMDVARRAEACGLDGLFVFDHLWPMGQRGRPALSALPLLGAVASATRTIAIGTLVARIGLLPDEVLLCEFDALCRVAPGRVIAGLGLGDRRSAEENIACGIGVAPLEARLSSLRWCARRIGEVGARVWLGGGSPAVVDMARELTVPINLWESDGSRLARLSAEGIEVTWGGPLQGSAGVRTRFAGEIEKAGASWFVWGWPSGPEAVAEIRDAIAASRRP